MTEPLVLDTDVTSFFFHQDPVRIPRYQRIAEGRTLYLPFVVVAERLFGAELRRWGPARRARLELFLRDYAVIDSAPDIIRVWASLRAEAQRQGTMIERQDAWVAAVALTLDLPLMTHNASDYTAIPLLRVITAPDR